MADYDLVDSYRAEAIREEGRNTPRRHN